MDTHVIRASITRALMASFTMFPKVFKTYEKSYIRVRAMCSAIQGVIVLLLKSTSVDLILKLLTRLLPEF